MNRPTVVELFAGAGLFGHAFKKAGFELIQAVELEKVAAATYSANLGSHVVVGDVSKLSPKGKCDVLVAGPPCQGFSTLGSRRPDDPRNSLCFEIVRWAKVLRPRYVVIENVSAFLNSWQSTSLRRRLVRAGYHVDSMVLNSFDYGCPQVRERSFTIANRIGIEFKPPRRGRRQTTVREALEGLPLRPDGVNHHYAPTPSELAVSRMRLIPEGGDRRDVMASAPELSPPSWWKLSCQVTDAWGRMQWDRPCNTLRTCLQNPSKGRYIHPSQNRVISLREAARLHSIPDNWKFIGTPVQVARQIGNSVPPNLGYAVAKAIRSAI